MAPTPEEGRMIKRAFLCICGACALGSASPATARASTLLQQVAHVPKFVKVATDLGPSAPSALLTLSIHLRYPKPLAVARFVQAVNDPASPMFGAFLSPLQFTQAYGPTGHTYSTVEYAITNVGGSVLQTFPNNKVLIVSVPVLVADLLFATQIDQYAYNSTTYYANSKPAYLPSVLKGLVRSVSGFTDFATTVSQPPWPIGAPGFGPGQIQTAYDEPIHVNSKLTGAGATIAIATAGDYLDGDVNRYWATYGVQRTGSLSRTFVASGARRRAPILGPETTLDVEQTTSSAPGANVTVYEGADTQSATFDAVYEQIVDDPHVDVVTTSFGACEIGADETEMNSDNDLFEEGAAEGQTWFAASGDNGSHDCGQNAPPFGGSGHPNPNSVDFPASSPFVAAAGGTTLTLNVDGSIEREKGWAGSGGGGSRMFARPPYQNPVPTLADPTARNVPDAALNADPRTPYAFFYLGSFAQSIGGTSAVAPNLAALYAQVAQGFGYRLGLAQTGLYYGFTTQTYPGGAAWHDITVGRNGRYRARTGYDDVTGLGSLDGYQLMLQMPPAAHKTPL
jgi:kumamolisin